MFILTGKTVAVCLPVKFGIKVAESLPTAISQDDFEVSGNRDDEIASQMLSTAWNYRIILQS